MRTHAATAPDDVDGVPWRDVAARRVRSRSLQLTRKLAWRFQPSAFPTARVSAGGSFPVLLHRRTVSLVRSDPGANPVFEEGKRVNISLAAPAFDGLLLEAGRTFSFWRTVGQPSESRGYRHGMELRGGCVVPAVGGGLCLLSNALFRAAAELGWGIVERHGHTIEAIPSTELPWGVDATIAWPYIDLRFAVPAGDPAARLGVRVAGDQLVIEVWSAGRPDRAVDLVGIDDHVEVVEGQRVRRNRIERRISEGGAEVRREIIGENAKRLLVDADLGRSCLTCGLDSCAGRVTIR